VNDTKRFLGLDGSRGLWRVGADLHRFKCARQADYQTARQRVGDGPSDHESPAHRLLGARRAPRRQRANWNRRGAATLSTGAGVGGVVVTIAGTALSTVTTTGGAFSIDNVPAGTHQITWTRIGLQPGSRDISVLPNQTTQVNLVVVAAPIPVGLVSPNPPNVPLPRDSLKVPVPDSVILGPIDQREGSIPVNLYVGQRFRLISIQRSELMIEIESVRRSVDLNEFKGVIIADGFRGGLVTVLMRGSSVTANIRHGLRLFMIRPQYRGIHLLIEVDARKLSGDHTAHDDMRTRS
jgi:hypothetical protein